MSEIRWVQTETPDDEQWRLLSQYRYPANTQRLLAVRGLASTSGVEDHVASSIAQSEAYFSAARLAPLDIAPLLSYYGATSLLSGVGAVLAGRPLPTTEHGMTLVPPRPGMRVSDVELTIPGKAGGHLRLIAGVLDLDAAVPVGSRWQLGELFASLPDLTNDAHLCLPTLPPYALRVDVRRRQGITVERIAMSEFRHHDPMLALGQVPGFRQTYLAPQQLKDAVVMHRRIGAAAIGTEGLNGQKALLVGHLKGGRLCAPGQLLTVMMALFALGMLSRYHSPIWHPFVRTDSTGERLLVERFIVLANRWLPNLALSLLTGATVRFTAAGIRPSEAFANMSESDLRALINEVYDEKQASAQ